MKRAKLDSSSAGSAIDQHPRWMVLMPEGSTSGTFQVTSETIAPVRYKGGWLVFELLRARFTAWTYAELLNGYLGLAALTYEKLVAHGSTFNLSTAVDVQGSHTCLAYHTDSKVTNSHVTDPELSNWYDTFGRRHPTFEFCFESAGKGLLLATNKLYFTCGSDTSLQTRGNRCDVYFRQRWVSNEDFVRLRRLSQGL